MIPSQLFREQNQGIFNEVQKHISKKYKYLKQYYQARIGTKVILSSWSIMRKNKLCYKKSNYPKLIMALGVVINDFEQGFVNVNIMKINTNNILNTYGEILCDPKICYPISEKNWQKYLNSNN